MVTRAGPTILKTNRYGKFQICGLDNHQQESLSLTDFVVFDEAVISNIDGKLK